MEVDQGKAGLHYPAKARVVTMVRIGLEVLVDEMVVIDKVAIGILRGRGDAQRQTEHRGLEDALGRNELHRRAPELEAELQLAPWDGISPEPRRQSLDVRHGCIPNRQVEHGFHLPEG